MQYDVIIASTVMTAVWPGPWLTFKALLVGGLLIRCCSAGLGIYVGVFFCHAFSILFRLMMLLIVVNPGFWANIKISQHLGNPCPKKSRTSTTCHISPLYPLHNQCNFSSKGIHVHEGLLVDSVDRL